jgi:hypothetical protein
MVHSSRRREKEDCRKCTRNDGREFWEKNKNTDMMYSRRDDRDGSPA